MQSQMFDFPGFCRQWALSYKPFHQSGKKTQQNCCLLHDTIDEQGEIVKRLVSVQDNGLFMSVITAYDGGLFSLTEDASRPNFYSWRRHVLFWARAGATPANVRRTAQPASIDEDAAAQAKSLAVEVAQDYIAFLSAMTDKHLTANPVMQIDWQDGPPTVATLPVSFNGWYIASVSFTQLQPRQKCLVPERYDTAQLQSAFPTMTRLFDRL